jgi:hypothetical protein
LIGLSDKNITLISEIAPSEQESYEMPNTSYKSPKKTSQNNLDLVKPIENQSLSFSSFLKSAFSKNN